MASPLSVVSTVVRKGDEILLIKRARGAYAGYWSIPGGKVEPDEHLADAAERELAEEAAIDASFHRHVGVVSELLQDEGAVQHHLLMHICTLTTDDETISKSDEGDVQWVSPMERDEMQAAISSRDYAILEQLEQEGDLGYYNSVVNHVDGEYDLVKFTNGK